LRKTDVGEQPASMPLLGHFLPEDHGAGGGRKGWGRGRPRHHPEVVVTVVVMMVVMVVTMMTAKRPDGWG
jgi:hypothetical protein